MSYSPTLSPEERELEAVAMNIVFQLGDALYDALPKDIAHDNFVDARQATNDKAIDFTKKLIAQHIAEAEIKIHDNYWHLQQTVTKEGIGPVALEFKQEAEKTLEHLRSQMEEKNNSPAKDECSFDGSIIKMCATLEAVVEDRHKKGLVMLNIYAATDTAPTLVRTVLVAKNGAYRKNGIVCNYCPFCAVEIYRNQPWQQRLKR